MLANSAGAAEKRNQSRTMCLTKDTAAQVLPEAGVKVTDVVILDSVRLLKYIENFMLQYNPKPHVMLRRPLALADLHAEREMQLAVIAVQSKTLLRPGATQKSVETENEDGGGV